MALTPVEQVRLLIGDTEGSPFYPLYTDDQVQSFLDMTNQNIYQAARMAAISASFQFAGMSSRERTGDIEVWNTLSSQYMKALDYLIANPEMGIPNGVLPWSHSVDMSGLTSISLCSPTDCHTFEWQRVNCPTRQCTTAPCSCRR